MKRQIVHQKKVFMLEDIRLERAVINHIVVNKFKKDDYGRIRTYSFCCGLFSTLKKAEKSIEKIVARTDKYDTFNRLGFIVKEKVVDDPIGEFWDDNSVQCEFHSLRSYDFNGKLIALTDADSAGYENFDGRDEPAMFKPGDIAWCFNNWEVEPVLVGTMPWTKAEWKKHMAPDAHGDASDDAYLVFSASIGHCHPMTPMLFPCRDRVSKKLMKKIEKSKREYYSS